MLKPFLGALAGALFACAPAAAHPQVRQQGEPVVTYIALPPTDYVEVLPQVALQLDSLWYWSEEHNLEGAVCAAHYSMLLRKDGRRIYRVEALKPANIAHQDSVTIDFHGSPCDDTLPMIHTHIKDTKTCPVCWRWMPSPMDLSMSLHTHAPWHLIVPAPGYLVPYTNGSWTKP